MPKLLLMICGFLSVISLHVNAMDQSNAAALLEEAKRRGLITPDMPAFGPIDRQQVKARSARYSSLTRDGVELRDLPNLRACCFGLGQLLTSKGIESAVIEAEVLRGRISEITDRLADGRPLMSPPRSEALPSYVQAHIKAIRQVSAAEHDELGRVRRALTEIEASPHRALVSPSRGDTHSTSSVLPTRVFFSPGGDDGASPVYRKVSRLRSERDNLVAAFGSYAQALGQTDALSRNVAVSQRDCLQRADRVMYLLELLRHETESLRSANIALEGQALMLPAFEAQLKQTEEQLCMLLSGIGVPEERLRTRDSGTRQGVGLPQSPYVSPQRSVNATMMSSANLF